MINGVQPITKDHRDYSANRTFGVVTTVFPDSLNFDAGFRFPDQNAEGLPQGCTGYTQSELCQDEDRVQYQPRFTYDKTIYMSWQNIEGLPQDIRTSIKSTIMYGVLPNTALQKIAGFIAPDVTDTEASKHRRAAYYVLEKNEGLDWFDSIRNMLLAGSAIEYDTGISSNRSISMVTPWYREWTRPNVPKSGIVKRPAGFDVKAGGASTSVIGKILDLLARLFGSSGGATPWHNWKISGWKTIDGVPYLMGKTWQGLVGDTGWMYYSREIVNELMEIYGTGGFIVFRSNPANDADIQTVKLTVLDDLKSYTRVMLKDLKV